MPFNEKESLDKLIESVKKRQQQNAAPPAPSPEANKNAPYPSGQNRPKTYEEQLLEKQRQAK